MPINETATKIFAEAEKKLHDDFTSFLEQLSCSEGTPEGKFMERVLEWKNNRLHHLYLYMMFEHAFDTENTLNFFDSLNSFVANCLLDDAFYHLEWVKADYLMTDVEFHGHTMRRAQTQWLPGGRLKTMVTTKEDPEGRPTVRWTNGDDESHSQDVHALLEAMDIMEQRESDQTEKMQRILGTLKDRKNT